MFQKHVLDQFQPDQGVVQREQALLLGGGHGDQLAPAVGHPAAVVKTVGRQDEGVLGVVTQAGCAALQGADVLFYPTAIGWHPLEKEQYGENQHGAWMNVMKGHAVANGVYVAAANRIGLEQYLPDTAGIQFWGSSFIAGPQGEILAQASHDKEEILIAEVDLDLQENVRQNWPFFRDRRIDAFGDITKRAID